MNIVLIVSDTFRQDHLGCYGNRWIHTPHLDQFSERAVVFDRCYASSFSTMPARADLFTGKYTFTYSGWAPLTPREVILAGVLTGAGYQTFGVTDTPFFVRRGYGYDRGFEDFHWVRGQNPGPERDAVVHAWRYEEDRFAPVTIATAEKWLERHCKDKFFLYVDTWDPHEPWDPPAYYIERYYESYAGGKSVYPCYWDWEEAGITEEELKLAHASYCGEVTMVDRWAGRLLERIESLGLMENTIIIFASDHGFAFGDHGLFGKHKLRNDFGFLVEPIGRDSKGGAKSLFRSPETGDISTSDGEAQWYRCPLYDEIARVPLLVYMPGASPGRSNALVTIPDLMPTILELAEAEMPETVQAPSIVPLLEGKQKKIRDFVVTTMPLYPPEARIKIVDDLQRQLRELSPSTITSDEWTLIYTIAGDPIELYHTVSDPRQEENVFEDNQEVAEELHQQFVQFLEELETDAALLGPRRSLR